MTAALRLPERPAGEPGLIPGIHADGSLYPIGKMEAHRRGVLHSAISVFVFEGAAGELLLQRRALGKYHCGGLWANTCCTHPHWGEDVAAAAARRLGEELGFSASLTPHAQVEYEAPVGNGLIEHERVQIFSAIVDRQALALDPDPAEVMETRWISPARLAAEIEAQPRAFTPWLRIYLERFPGLQLA